MPYFHVPKNYRDDMSDFNVDTLFIRPLKRKSEGGQLKRDDILIHFSTFGVVKAVRVRNKPTRLYGFVTFTETESAAKALEIEIHTIAGRKVEVTVAYRRHQHRTNLLDLNDDCIFEILEYLSMQELCSIADTSCRLRKIAKRVFRVKQKNWDVIDELYRDEFKLAERFFVNFGSLMSHLIFYYDFTRIMDYVTKYCGNALKSVYFAGCYIDENLTDKLRPIFKNLKTLQLEYTYFRRDSKKLLADCESLVELILEDVPISLIIENTFPKLEILRCQPSDDEGFDNGSDDEEDLVFDSFVLRHKNLKQLSVWNYNITSSLIADNCKRLERLEFDIPAGTTFDLPNLDHLKMLWINCNNQSVTESTQGWNNLNALEEISLGKGNVDSNFVKTLSQLKRLRTLQMFDCTGIQNLYRMSNLHQLTYLHIESESIYVEVDLVRLTKRLCNLTRLGVMMYGFSIDDKTYWKIVDVVGRRRDESQLILAICGKEGKCLKEKDLRRLNSPLVQIELLCDSVYEII